MDEMTEKLLQQHISGLEFRIRTLEQAVLQSGNRVAQLELLFNRGATRLIDEIINSRKDQKQ